MYFVTGTIQSQTGNEKTGDIIAGDIIARQKN